MEGVIRKFIQEVSWGNFKEDKFNLIHSTIMKLSLSQMEDVLLALSKCKYNMDNGWKIVKFCTAALDRYGGQIFNQVIGAMANAVHYSKNKSEVIHQAEEGLWNCISRVNPICPDTASYLINTGEKLAIEYRWKEAYNYFRLAHYMYPLHIEAKAMCGECCFEMKEFANAVSYFLLALDLPAKVEKRITLWKKLGLAYFHIGKYQTSQKFLRTAHQYKKEAETALFIGKCCHEEGQLEEGALFLKRTIDEGAESAAFEILLGKIYYDMGVYKEAVKCFNRCISLQPDTIEAKGLINKAREKLNKPSGNYNKSVKGAGKYRKKLQAEKKLGKKADSGRRLKSISACDYSCRGVVGMKEVFELLEDAYYRITYNEALADFGLTPMDGILLIGPPGCGKSLSIKVFAEENDLPLHTAKINEILNMWVGESEKGLHKLFETAKNTSPCVLFFDELDSLGISRSSRQGWARTLMSTFLLELDELNNNNISRVILAGATNVVELIDPALIRPGRFGTHIRVSEPDDDLRRKLVDFYLSKIKVGCRDVDAEKLVKETKGWTCAQIKALVEGAAKRVWKMFCADNIKRPVTQDDFALCLEEMKDCCAAENFKKRMGFRKDSV